MRIAVLCFLVAAGSSWMGVAHSQQRSTVDAPAAAMTGPEPVARSDTAREIRLGGPAAGGGQGAEDSSVIYAVTLDDLLAFAKIAGMADATIATSAKDPNVKLVNGTISSVPVNMFVADCEQQMCKDYALLAFFGKQDGVSPSFATAFNSKNYNVLKKYETGEVVLQRLNRTNGGVTRAHVQWIVSSFAGGVDFAIQFKP